MNPYIKKTLSSYLEDKSATCILVVIIRNSKTIAGHLSVKMLRDWKTYFATFIC